MLDFDSGNCCGNRRCHFVCYRLLEGGVYNWKVSSDVFEIGNCSKKLVYVCKLGAVVKTRRSVCCCSCFSLENIQKMGIYWLSSSYTIDKCL